MDGSATAMLLLLSGAAALMQQVAWVRLLAPSLGSSGEAVGVVLAACAAGLALGQRLAGRLGARWPGLAAFARLELLLVVSGPVLLVAALHLDPLVAAWPAIARQHAARFVVAFALSMVPAFAIGAGFPVLLGAAACGGPRSGATLARLAAALAAGGATGALAAASLAIPWIGLDGTLVAAALLHGVAALGAWLVARRALAAHAAAEAARPPDPLVVGVPGPPPAHLATPPWADSDAPHRGPALFVLLACGAVGLLGQMAWTRWLALFIGTTVIDHALLLVGLLAGVALGAWCVRDRLDAARPARAWLVGGLFALCAGLLASRAILGRSAAISDWMAGLPLGHGAWLALRTALVGAALLPTTIVLGALVPFALTLYCGRLAAGAPRVGRGCAAVTLAGLVGMALAQLVVLRRVGTDGTLLTAVALAGGAGLALVACLRSARERRLALAAAALLALGAIGLPRMDLEAAVASVQDRLDPPVRGARRASVLYLREGSEGVVSVTDAGGRFARLAVDGLPVSLLDRSDPNDGPIAETLLGLMPAFLRPGARSAFVLGYGSGATTAALVGSALEEVRVVEREPAVIDAVASVWGEFVPALRDPRVRLTIGDARSLLLTEPERYDILVVKPGSGAARLATREFFALADARLGEDGVCGQWVDLARIDSDTLGSVLAAFYGVFPHGFTMVNARTSDMLLLGSRRPLVLDLDAIAHRMDELPDRTGLEREGIRHARDLLLYFSLSRTEALAAAAGLPPDSDTRLLTETRQRAPGAVPRGGANPFDLLARNYRFDLRPYLPERTVARDLHDAGMLFLEWRSARNATLAADRLAELDLTLAGNLRRAIDKLAGN